MSKSAKQHPIKAIINFRGVTADAVVTAAVNIAGTVYNNPKFAGASPQPVDQPTLKAATDALVAGNAAAVDGGKKAVQEQKHLKGVVVKFLTQLAHWAEANCKEDMRRFFHRAFRRPRLQSRKLHRSPNRSVRSFWGPRAENSWSSS